MSLRDALLSLKQRQTKWLQVPLLGDVIIQVPAETQRAEIETSTGAATVKRLVVVHCVVGNVDCSNRKPGETWMADPGEPLFRKSDIDSMGAVNSTVLDDIATAALALCRLSRDDMATLLGEHVPG